MGRDRKMERWIDREKGEGEETVRSGREEKLERDSRQRGRKRQKKRD